MVVASAKVLSPVTLSSPLPISPRQWPYPERRLRQISPSNPARTILCGLDEFSGPNHEPVLGPQPSLPASRRVAPLSARLTPARTPQKTDQRPPFQIVCALVLSRHPDSDSGRTLQ